MRRVLVSAACVLTLAAAAGCASGADALKAVTTASASPAGAATGATTGPVSPAPSTETTVAALSKTVAADGAVTLGDLSADGFSLALPSDAYQGVAGVLATRAASSSAPAMDGAALLGDGYAVDTQGVGRLDDAATLTYSYDADATADPMLLALAYHDGQKWTYIPAVSADTASHTVSFPIFHFSAYYPSQFKSELEAAKHYSEQLAARKVLGEGGGDPKVASRALADLVAAKLGLGGDQFSKKMLADIAADQDVMKVFDEYQKEGWTDTGYAYVMNYVCGKVANRLIESKTAPASGGEAALQNMWDLLKVSKSGAKFLGYVMEGDMKDAGKELFDLATDYTGIPGKALKYTLQGMQNALDVWRDGEVEKAFEVYVKGSSGTLFGYGAVDPLNFDEVWDNMKGARRQLSIERIRTENDARATLGLPPLSPEEEDLYREKVKQELKSEFDRRIALKGKIEQQKKNLDLILDELDASKLLEKGNIWIRKIDPNETLESRLTRFNQLIGRIFSDLKITDVYGGPQQEGELNGRISAMSMAEMLRGYFAANTQAEAEKFLQEYYKKFRSPLQEMAGTYEGSVTSGGGMQFSVDITVEDDGQVSGTIHWAGSITTATGPTKMEYTFSFTGAVTPDGKLTAEGTMHAWDEESGGASDWPEQLTGQITKGVFKGTWDAGLTGGQHYPIEARVQ